MKPRYVLLAALAATSLYALAADSTEKLSDRWLVTGATPKAYEAGVDPRETVSGKGAKFLRHVPGDGAADGKEWGTLMQQISAERYRGQRVRFQAQVKTHEVSGWAGLWMRIDSPQHNGVAFYNSGDKPIKGSTDWQTRNVVLDVAPDASVLSFGVIGGGTGQVWIDALTLDVVGDDVPVSRAPSSVALPSTPSL